MEGFEALRLSILGAWKLFGDAAFYLVCVNCLDGQDARKRTGELPVEVEWRAVSRKDLPDCLTLAGNFAEGTGWKFCPVRAFEGMPELALDNDCILWSMPAAVADWLRHGHGCVIAEDVRQHFGRFSSRCAAAPRNSGIRGLGPEFPFEEALAELTRDAGTLSTEGDEQGLQVACLQARGNPGVVSLREVTICSPFPPHAQVLGTCGVHFVGLNTKRFAWSYYGQDPVVITRQHWQRMKPAVLAKVSSSP